MKNHNYLSLKLSYNHKQLPENLSFVDFQFVFCLGDQTTNQHWISMALLKLDVG